MSENKTIRVSGDCICDHNVYKGNRSTAVSSEARGVRVMESCGGALLLKELIAKATADMPGWKTEFGHSPDFKTLPDDYHAFCLWEPQVANPWEKDIKKQSEVWRAAEPPLGYGQRSEKPTVKACGKGCCESSGNQKDLLCKAPDIVVIDDAGLGFRNAEAKDQWPFVPQSEKSQDPRYVVLKVTGSVGEGKLWANLVARNKRNMVLIVSADQLRCDEVRISRGLSWEATAEDLMAEINDNPALQPLLQARHLIVTFRSDGAFWMDNDKEGHRPSMLVFDSAMAEGEWSESQGKGTTFGFMSCFVAAVVRQLCCTEGAAAPDFEAALIAGLSASRALRRLGHGQVKIPDPTDSKKEIDNPDPGFPFDGIAATIRQPTEKFVSAVIPGDKRERGSWMMLDEWQVHARKEDKQRPHHEAAVAVAVLGPEALERFPVAKFGNYQTVDRKEIESLRTIRQLISNYKKEEHPKNPLSLGVFGPPGSGKSFIVIEIAKGAGIKKEDVLLFNLSQFNAVSDLIGALHRIRDKVLSGVTPIAFWDEFDSQSYKWLQYLLAPMEDGLFQDGQITHPIGKCIFVFAGATSSTYAKFGPCNPNLLSKDERKRLEKDASDHLREVENAWREFVLAKGPDFKSRLVGYLDLLGMNSRLRCEEKDLYRLWEEDKSDLCCPIRRAFFIRSLFELKERERLRLDPNVLRALLAIPFYKSGGRSVQVLCGQLRHNNSGTSPSRSNLPGHDFLEMHVDADTFWQLCEQDRDFVLKGKELAPLLHEAFRLRIKNRPEKKHQDVPFRELPKDMQDANIDQAFRIPRILRLAGMHLEVGPVVSLNDLSAVQRADTCETPIRQVLADKDNLELLAEAEHNGWMVERMLNGWKYGRDRDDERKTNNCLIPYSQLSERIKDYDRWTIIGHDAPADKPNEEQFGYVDIVKTVGLRVVKDAEKPVPSNKA